MGAEIEGKSLLIIRGWAEGGGVYLGGRSHVVSLNVENNLLFETFPQYFGLLHPIKDKEEEFKKEKKREKDKRGTDVKQNKIKSTMRASVARKERERECVREG